MPNPTEEQKLELKINEELRKVALDRIRKREILIQKRLILDKKTP